MAINRIADVLPAMTALLRRRKSDREDVTVGSGDPILALRGMGKELWEDEDADAYVDRLRDGWQ